MEGYDNYGLLHLCPPKIPMLDVLTHSVGVFGDGVSKEIKVK